MYYYIIVISEYSNFVIYTALSSFVQPDNFFKVTPGLAGLSRSVLLENC